MKKIALTQGKFALVDDADFAALSKFKWCAHWDNGKSWSVLRHVKYVTKPGGARRSQPIKMQYQLLGTRPGFTIDHRDRNSFNFQRKNLRWATRYQQQANRIVPDARKYRGVQQHRRKFVASLKHSGKLRYLGLFETPELAAVAYNRGATETWGEFAVLNKV